MGENRLGRRQALRGAGVTAGGVAVAGLATTPAMAGDDDDNHKVLGSWLVRRQDDGSTDVAWSVLSFAAGGVAITHDISPAGPPFTGTFASRGKWFRGTVWSGFPGQQGPGSLGPAVRVRFTGSVEDDKISGTYRFTVFAPGSLTQVEERGTGKFHGRRIEA